VHGASPAVTLVRFAHRVEAELGITVSVGLAPNKFLAKVASDLEKPRGFTVIRSDEARTFLAERTVGIIPGIGVAAQARLARAGIVLIRHLTERPAADLAQVVGRDAERLRSLAVGVDGRPVRLSREAKGVSAETTLNADLADYEALQPVLWRLSERVALRLKRSGLAGRSVTLKLKNRTFRLGTRARSGLPPTQLATRLYEAALPLLRAECDGTTFRLIGIGASDLCDGTEADRGDLADAGVVRDAQREAAIDRLRERFGPDAVRRGLSLRGPQR
jgi:DNA polymerase IV